MKKIIFILILICLSNLVLAEEKTTEMVPKLTAAETIDAPTIVDSSVYPFWGVPCTNYTYYAIYKDEKGREPEYMRIWLNGEWHDMTLLKGDPKNGATYTYNYIPTSGSSNFYYFEASNGVGKVRASIIDSPDNGPVLFSEKFDNNEIVLFDKSGKEIWSFDTGVDWVEGVAISKDGNYIAAVTNFYIYLFSKDSKEPLWSFCRDCEIPPSLISGTARGIAISANGSYIAADMQGTLYFFNKDSNKPLWTANIESGSIGVDMSDDANVIAAGVGEANGGRGQKIFLFDKEGNRLGDYKPSHPGYDQTGDFYQPDVTPDGKYVAATTGCPDRRAYLFSKEGELLFRSEQLTFDSPVHKSAISDDGSLIAYSADHQQGKEIVFLLNNKGKKIWSFSSQDDSTARAVSISADGNYLAAGKVHILGQRQDMFAGAQLLAYMLAHGVGEFGAGYLFGGRVHHQDLAVLVHHHFALGHLGQHLFRPFPGMDGLLLLLLYGLGGLRHVVADHGRGRARAAAHAVDGDDVRARIRCVRDGEILLVPGPGEVQGKASRAHRLCGNGLAQPAGCIAGRGRVDVVSPGKSVNVRKKQYSRDEENGGTSGGKLIFNVTHNAPLD